MDMHDEIVVFQRFFHIVQRSAQSCLPWLVVMEVSHYDVVGNRLYIYYLAWQCREGSTSDCHTVQNIVVGGIIGEVAPSFSSEAGRLCPKCSSMNIRRWNRHTCPKCGGEMVADGKDEFWT